MIQPSESSLAMATAKSQFGVLGALPSLARYLTFTLHKPEHAREALMSLAAVTDGHSLLVGIGLPLTKLLQTEISGLRLFPAMNNCGVSAPGGAHALWCWLRAESGDRGDLLHASRHLVNTLAPAFQLASAVDAFKFGSGRDLTGYEDGTENPKDSAASAAALVADRGAGLDGSSFVAVQQWRHDLNAFDALTPDEQDRSIGRRKSDNQELSDAPSSAHVKRTAQESFSPQAFLMRRSMPWFNEQENGLMFVAFGCSFDAFEAQLRRMMGYEDSVTDALFRYSQPIGGDYYWCPPLQQGRLDLSALHILS